ncbi:MAG: TIGR04076 family protein [Candidatus Hodarchaeales archaeon]
MPEYDVKLKIVDILGGGKCPVEYKKGDEFSWDDPKLCMSARHSLMPFAMALRFGGEVPWRDQNKDEMTISCPDGDNPVVFKLTRALKKK